MNYKEESLQMKCYVWFHNTYPKLRGCLNYNLNNSKNARDGARNRALGLQAGRSDMVMYYKNKAYMIELKTEEGSQQKNQKEWQKVIEEQGFNYYIVRNEEGFQKLLHNILNEFAMFAE